MIFDATEPGITAPSEDDCTEPLIVPENADAKNVLALFRKRKNHICCVVNEYGGFEGIISLHDIFENIVGHLPDERDSDEPDVFMREDHSYLINGDAPIERLGPLDWQCRFRHRRQCTHIPS